MPRQTDHRRFKGIAALLQRRYRVCRPYLVADPLHDPDVDRRNGAANGLEFAPALRPDLDWIVWRAADASLGDSRFMTDRSPPAAPPLEPTLPRDAYVSCVVFDAERERIFAREWVLV